MAGNVVEAKTAAWFRCVIHWDAGNWGVKRVWVMGVVICCARFVSFREARLFTSFRRLGRRDGLRTGFALFLLIFFCCSFTQNSPLKKERRGSVLYDWETAHTERLVVS
ncbi:hypothetical protein EDB80DRAFT_400444 [Ilyonectria destructans]|nr:hypothetical protein EDB80DRAFT_400444 [Ilyonectria destructans]